jgi:hypothetical protein
MRLLGSSAKKGGYEDLAAASGEARLRRAKPAPSVSGDIAEAADKVGSDRKGRKGRRDKGDRIKPNQTKSNLRGSWRVPKLDNPMGRESAEGSLVKRSQTRSNSIQPNSPRSSPVKPSQTQSNSIRRGQTESNRIKPNQTESNRIKPNQTKSNLRGWGGWPKLDRGEIRVGSQSKLRKLFNCNSLHVFFCSDLERQAPKGGFSTAIFAYRRCAELPAFACITSLTY